MYALFIILNDVSLLDDIHEILYGSGVGATTMDSSGLGKVLLQHNIQRTTFASMRKLLEGDKPYNKTIISVINCEDKLTEVVEKLMNKLGGISEPGVGFMFVIPVLHVYGYKAMEDYGKNNEVTNT